MSTGVQSIKLKQAHLIMAGASFKVLAQDPSDQQAAKSGPGFEMVLYTGATFSGHYYWGDVVLDVKGFQQHRQDIPALWAHWGGSVGYTQAMKADAETATITASGRLIAGTDEQEPEANRVRRRLEQGAPLQCSGRWVPKLVEKVMAGAKATVNGKVIQGPVTIFRSFICAEASFVDLGWDPMTSAVAASDSADRSVQVEVQGANQEKPIMSLEIIAALKPIFGAEKAIELVTAKPEAKGLGDFTQDIVAHASGLTTKVTDLTATVAAKDGEIATLKSELAQAKARPAVITAKPDGSQPVPPAGAPQTDEQIKADYNAKAELQAEFGSVEAYLTHVHREQEKARA